MNTSYEEVEVTTLDSYLEKNPLDIGFIKVDIEGFEQEFLKGAVNTIKTQKPTMLISIYYNPNDFF
ncbi:FkbM family methyltransferase [Campylobacter sp. VicNov18]|nr:FkbM family methyltransferase [Campylobacter bilis]MCC8278461.1 FkbM family methyltransferase [Campylobacter bilis]MCC8299965.1 FkbM family methyltransferase [Campylobacter bilis]MCC8301370.1 FkbM family methyltransferase [Campylobacter bilis]MCC8350533.1 FkbM family methyltransferase [Campylobacter bilis]MCC8356147.1 FkbM family methyltransferase [Campylobacter bilis]